MTEKPAHHRVDVVKINEVRPHPNADRLEIIPIEGYQAIVAKGQFKVGDLAYYVPPDSVVPDREEFAFLWKNEKFEGGTPIKKRRITARRLRGEWSEGLLMPINDLKTIAGPGPKPFGWEPDDDVSELLGIEHYNAVEDNSVSIADGPLSFFGRLRKFFFGKKEAPKLNVPTYDVDSIKKYMKVFQPGEPVTVTEKIHGSNARYSFRKGGWLKRDKMWAGSKNVWKAADSNCAWRKALKDNPWIETWCKKHPGYTLYGEITPIHSGFNYGSEIGVIYFWVFDVLSPEGKWLSIFDFDGFLRVPVLYTGPFDLEKIASLVDGPTHSTGQHIREGIVIRADRPTGRVQLKWVSNSYLEKDSK